MHSLDSVAHESKASDAHCHLLGKRRTLLNLDSFHALSKSVDENTSPLKRQRMAAHINTRHVATHFPHSSHQQNTSEPTLSPVNLSFQEPLADSTERQQPSTSYASDDAITSDEDISMDKVNSHPTSDYAETSSNVSSLDTRVSPSNIALTQTLDRLVLDDGNSSNNEQSTSSTELRQEGQSSNAITQVVADAVPDVLSDDDDDIVAMVQATGFFRRVQSWANTIEKIGGDRERQQLHHELFGEKLTFKANSPDLLNLLETIDQQKNQVTLQEEHFTNLADKIDKILKTCQSPSDWQLISLATRILDNFYQRFQNRRFP